MVHKYEIAKNWLPRYTGMQPDDFGDYILLTKFGFEDLEIFIND